MRQTSYSVMPGISCEYKAIRNQFDGEPLRKGNTQVYARCPINLQAGHIKLSGGLCECSNVPVGLCHDGTKKAEKRSQGDSAG